MTAEGAAQGAISERESGYIHPGDGQLRDLSQLGRRTGSRPGIRRALTLRFTFRTVTMHRPFAFDSTDGGMTLSGPNDCRGSTKLTSDNPHTSHTKREF